MLQYYQDLDAKRNLTNSLCRPPWRDGTPVICNSNISCRKRTTGSDETTTSLTVSVAPSGGRSVSTIVRYGYGVHHRDATISNLRSRTTIQPYWSTSLHVVIISCTTGDGSVFGLFGTFFVTDKGSNSVTYLRDGIGVPNWTPVCFVFGIQ